jgi:antitoxin PrlF
VVLLLQKKVRIAVMGYALTSKSQVTVPKDVRQHLGIGPGDRVIFASNDRGEMVIKAEPNQAQKSESALREAQANFRMDISVDEFLEMTRGTDRYGRDV